MALAYAMPDASSVFQSSGSWFVNTSTAADCLDDPVNAPDDDLTYVYTTSPNAYFAILMAMPASLIVVNSVSVHIRVRAVTVVDLPFSWPLLRFGGNNYTNGGAFSIGTTYLDFEVAFTFNPATGLAWQPSDLTSQSIYAGILDQAQTDQMRLTQVYLVIDGLFTAGKIGATRDCGSRIVRLARRPIPVVNLRPALARAA